MSEENQAATEESGAEATTTTKPKKAPTVYTEVILTDERIVKFAGTRKVDKSAIIVDGIAVGARFDFVNGQTRSLLLADLAPATAAYAGAHGLIQKVGDEWSGEKDIDDIVLTADEIIGRLKKDGWTAEREAGDSMAGASIVIKALMEASKKSAEEIKAFLDKKVADAKAKGETLSRQQLYASFRNPTSTVGKIIRRLEEEKAAANSKVNADDLLGELGGAVA